MGTGRSKWLSAAICALACSSAAAQSVEETTAYIEEACSEGGRSLRFNGNAISGNTGTGISFTGNVEDIRFTSSGDSGISVRCIDGACLSMICGDSFACADENGNSWQSRNGTGLFLACRRPGRVVRAFEHLAATREAEDPFAG